MIKIVSLYVMKLLRIILPTALLLLSACSKQQDISGSKDIIEATFEEASGTKVYIDGEYKQHWNADDRITVFKGGGAGREYRFMGADGDKEGSFESIGEGEGGSGEIFAVYPHSANTSLSGEALNIDFPSTQTYIGPGFAPGASPMAARTDDNHLTFKNLCGALVLRLWGTGAVARITLQGNNSEPLAGRLEVLCPDGAPQVQVLSQDALTELTLICSPSVAVGDTPENATEFWFILPPATFEKGFTATVFDDAGRSFQAVSAKRIGIERSKVLKMTPVRIEPGNPVSVALGKPLPAWRQGYLDIHGINGGRGEAFYYIFPDGTTMLVDAAGGPQSEYGYTSGIASKPSVEISCGQVIVNYIRHFAPVVAGGRIDYFLATHYHGDHIGAWRNGYSTYRWQPVDKNGRPVSSANLDAGGFVVNGLPDVGMSIPINKVIDRGDWSDRPSVDYGDEGSQKRYANYVNFLDWSARNFGTVRENFAVGRTDQLVQLHFPDAYKSFVIRGIAAGGNIWTGSGTSVNTNYVPPASECLANLVEWDINENIYSCVFHLSYGKFDWFAGGDIQFTGRSTHSWKDIELPISKVMSKVEAMKASHHSTKNTNSAELLGVLKPDVYIAGVWQDVQPNPATIKRVLSASPSVKIFTTNLAESNVTTLTEEGVNVSKFSATQGHVVIRVLPGGGSYYVYVLDDSDLEYNVKAVFGPYVCK
ncbi:MAG: hypothetical protein J6X82_02210 [Bacteroidales bacterium]|nr:hypothetical protein [Bacteroidales bacterium]